MMAFKLQWSDNLMNIKTEVPRIVLLFLLGRGRTFTVVKGKSNYLR